MKILIPVAACLLMFSISKAESPPKDISLEDKKKIVDEWVKRSEQGIANNKRIMAIKNRTPEQECEAIIERGYLAAGILLKVQLEKDGIDSISADPTLLIKNTNDDVTIRFSYYLSEKTERNVQLVEVQEIHGHNAGVIFGGEHAPKGIFLVKSGDCTYMMDDSKPLTYKIIKAKN
jgi:hypothetical protein